jgi:hypothetical protein
MNNTISIYRLNQILNQLNKKVDTQLELLIGGTTFRRKLEQKAIFVLEESQKAFRSKQLECLRKRLTKALVDIRQTD